MRRFRTRVALVCGLMFLAQAFAVSAAQFAPAGSSMPCHGHMAADPARAGGHHSCCDEAKCADMAGCQLSQPAIAVVPELAVPAPATVFGVSILAAPAADPFSKSFLRPPIALHA